jgi:hypothetical protein
MSVGSKGLFDNSFIKFHMKITVTSHGNKQDHNLTQKQYDLYLHLLRKGYGEAIAIRHLEVPKSCLPMSQEDQDWMLYQVDSLHWGWVSDALKKGDSHEEILKEVEEIEKTL